MQSGQFYHPLTRARGFDVIPNSDKEVSETYSSRLSQPNIVAKDEK